MLSGVNIDLINYLNQNSTWQNVKKGPRSDTRCPRKPAGGSFKIGSELGSSISKNVQDSSVSESEQLGVAVLGEHFAENTTRVPVKKRRLLRQSSSPPPRTPSLNREASLSPESSTPSPNHEDSGQLVHSKSALGQKSNLNSYNKKKNGPKGTMKVKNTDQTTTREIIRSEDFSGIALLAAAACSSSIEDNVDNNVESSGTEQLATPEGNDVSRAGMKETVTTSESEGSSVSENALPVVQSVHCDNENDTGVKIHVPSKDTPRFHWDLNTVMDEWEEPCFSPPPNTVGTCEEGIVDDGLQFQSVKKEGFGSQDFDNTGREIETFVSGAQITSNKSDMVNLFAHPISSTSSLVGQDDVIVDLKGQGVVQGSGAENITNDLLKSANHMTLVTKGDVKLVAEVVGRDGGIHSLKTSEILDNDKLASENPKNECNGSEVFQDDKKHPADGDNMMKVQEGYDSPYEDGELREPLVDAWEEKEVEKWENECVDFEFDNEYEDEFDTCDRAISENLVVGNDNGQALVKASLLGEKNVDAVLGDELIQCAKDVSNIPSSLLGLKTSEGYQPQEICGNVKLEGNNSSSKFWPETKSGHNETRTFNGNMLHMDGSSPFDDLHRRGSTAYMKMSRSDYVDESYSQTERVFGSEKIMGRDRPPFQGRVRNEADCRWVDSARGDWDLRNNYVYTRSRNVIGDSDGKPNRINSHDHSQTRSYVPRGMSRSLNRRPSPTERSDSYPLQRRTQQPMRGFNRERSRGRAGFIPQGFRRGPPEEYHEPGPYYVGRKERGFSPSFNNRDSYVSRTHRRSRSRSRSMSPIAWNMNNRGTKRHSPESRTEEREMGERVPFRKPRFSGDFDQGLMSPPRGIRLSPQRNSRCFDDRKSIDGEYRERRSSPPVRMFRQNPRVDSGGYPERLKSGGDYFRTMTRPGAGRGPRNFDESIDDRRKPDDRYEAMDRVRRYDAGPGGVRRFRHEEDECFEPRYARNEGNNGFRGTVRRGAPASVREERSPPRIQREKLITGDATLTGDQDFDANASTKEV